MAMTIVVFNLEVGGHYPGYLRHLLRYWPATNDKLIFVVAPNFATLHQDVVQTASQARITWQPITQAELQSYQASKRSLVRWAWVEWRLYCRYATKLQADQGLIMYMDRFQLPLALGLFLPCETSGIFFRPKFHYDRLANRQPARGAWLRTQREQLLWRNALRHSQLRTVFCLDPLAVAPLRKLGGSANVIPLPDPVEVYPEAPDNSALVRQTLKIDPARKVLLLFGMIDRRKGIHQVLEALAQLPTAEQAQLALLLVGQVAEADRDAVSASLGKLRRDHAIQIIQNDSYIGDPEIQPLFAVADLVLALYQRHVGMSAILGRAAIATKPVLASNFGLMGHLVRQHRLGMAVDSTQPAQIGQALRAWLAQGNVGTFDEQVAQRFGQSNSARAFVDAVHAALAPALPTAAAIDQEAI